MVLEGIRAGAEKALKGDLTGLLKSSPEHFKVEIEYKRPPLAYSRSFYPGATLKNERFIVFETSDWFEILYLFDFVL